MSKRENSSIEENPEKKTKMTNPALSVASSLLVKKLVPQAKLPQRGSAFAAGYDLFSLVLSILKINEVKVF